jgi:hypothetical protein
LSLEIFLDQVSASSEMESSKLKNFGVLLHWYRLVQPLPIMLQPRIRCHSAAVDSSFASLVASLSALSLCRQHAKSTQTTFIRHASHAAQGRANGPKDSAGRRLGAKKTASQYVIPGNIIFKQRGTPHSPTPPNAQS